MLELMKENLAQARNRMKQQADKHRRPMELKVGDMVYLKNQPYKLKKLARRINQKLSPRYYGPYEVMERIGEVAYKLRLPAGSKVHPIFHVSLLKPTVAAEGNVQPLPKCVTENWELDAQPEEILAIRQKEDQEWEVLVKWKDMPTCKNSWECLSQMKNSFPEFNLEDKVNFVGGGVDSYQAQAQEDERQKEKVKRVYERKKMENH